MNNLFLRRFINETTDPDWGEFHGFLQQIYKEKASKQEVIAFITALSAKPLSSSNIANFVSFVRRVSPLKLLRGSEGAINIVGTGGGISTFNISTATALVASAAGVKVLKSGSAAYSSKCGSLDVLRALKVPMPEDEDTLAEMFNEFGIGFIPVSHYSILLRRMATMVVPLAFRDIAGFVNIVGPLICPYQVSAQMIGVSRHEYLDIFEKVTKQLKSPKTLLVRSDVGMDELCSIGVNHCRYVDSGDQSRSFTLPAKDYGFDVGNLSDLAGGNVMENSALLREVISGKRKGAARDTVILNSGALLYVAGTAPSISAGVERAQQVIDDGKALEQLERIVNWGQKTLGRQVSLSMS